MKVEGVVAIARRWHACVMQVQVCAHGLDRAQGIHGCACVRRQRATRRYRVVSALITASIACSDAWLAATGW
jgi:hypothetical protein